MLSKKKNTNKVITLEVRMRVTSDFSSVTIDVRR